MMATCLAATLAGQATDSLSVARRVVAAISLASKEYALGVAPAGGRILVPAEVEEAKLFIDQARLDVPALPAAVRARADSELAVLRGMLDRVAAPGSVERRATSIVQRIAAAAGGALDPFPSRPPSLARGAAVYREQCLECHGPAGHGDGPKARRLKGPPPADLTEPAVMAGASPVDVYRKITIGVAGTGMPEFDETVSADDRWAVATHVVTLHANDRKVREGEGLYAAHCAACHGALGGGDGLLAGSLSVRPPALRDLAVQGRFSDEELGRLIAQGRPGTPMPGYERVLDRDALEKLVAFVRVLPAAERQKSQPSPGAATFSMVRRQLDSAVALRSSELAFDAYLTFERVETEVRAKHAALAGELEDAFAALRTRAAAGADAAELEAVHQRLLSALERAERIVADRASGANMFVQSFILLLREGFEAILIIAALMTFLAKAGAPERRRQVAWGAWGAVAASVVTWALVELLFQITPGQREALEGGTMLLATAVLFSVSYWLFSKIEAAKWSAFVRGKMRDALSTGSGFALGSVAFLAVYREGFETILFYKALLTSGPSGGGSAAAVASGIALGAVALVTLYVGINRFGLRIPMKPFFAVTGAMLYYMAFVFAGKGIAELQEAGLVQTTVVEWGPRIPMLGIYPTVQSLVVQGTLAALLVVALVWVLRPRSLQAVEARSQ